MSSRKLFLDSLLRTRRSNQNIDSLFQKFEKSKANKRRPAVIKGVHRGRFIRVKVPPRQSAIPVVPKLPSPTGPALKPFKSVPVPPNTAAEAALSAQTAAGEQARQQKEKTKVALDDLQSSD